MYMIKKSLYALAFAAVVAVPLFVSAAVVSSGASVSVITNGMPVPPVSAPIVVAACYPFSRSLSIGASGSDVTALQNYLSAQGYFSVAPTGYFGVITRAAVGRWQAQNNVTTFGSSGSGIFGPLSRNRFFGLCGGNGGGSGNSGGGSTQAAASFSANPQSGSAPLTVQFVASAPQGTTLGNAVNFGDGTEGNLGVVPVCSSCNAEGIVSHTYTARGTYTATLTSGICTCPADGICNCPNMQIIATTTIAVGSTSTTTASSIEQLDAPGSVTLGANGIAEILNKSVYFTLQDIGSSSATIQIAPVGCWNSFPSNPAPVVICMIAPVPIPLQTLTVGQTYDSGSYSITLTQLSSGAATFGVN